MDTLIGVGLLVVLVVVYVVLGLGEGGTTCFRCDEEAPTEDCRDCPLRRVDAGGGGPGKRGGWP